MAVAIPIFNTQLEKSRDAVTASNIRNAYSEAASAFTLQEDVGNAVYLSRTDPRNVTSDGDWGYDRVLVFGVEIKGEQDGGLENYPWPFSLDTFKNHDGTTAAGLFNDFFGSRHYDGGDNHYAVLQFEYSLGDDTRGRTAGFYASIDDDTDNKEIHAIPGDFKGK